MEEKFGKFDLKIQELSTNLQTISTRWKSKHSQAQQTLKSLETKINSLKPHQESSQVQNFFEKLNFMQNEILSNKPEKELKFIELHIKEMQNLSQAIKNTENEISKAVKLILNEDEKHKKNMENLKKRENLLIDETEKLKEEIKENEEIIAGIVGEFDRMTRMSMEKEREIKRIGDNIDREQFRLKKEIDFLTVIEQKKIDYEESSDNYLENGFVQNLSEVCCKQRNVESAKAEPFEFSVFVIPSFLVLVLAMVLYL